MNYAAAFLVLILAFSAIYWYVSGRKFYIGPLIETIAEEEPMEGNGPSGEMEKDAEMKV
jgi:hypothetical protein